MIKKNLVLKIKTPVIILIAGVFSFNTLAKPTLTEILSQGSTSETKKSPPASQPSVQKIEQRQDVSPVVTIPSQSQNVTTQTNTVSSHVPSSSSSYIPGDMHRHSVGLGLGQTFLTGEYKDNGGSEVSWDILYTYSASYSFDFFADFHIEQSEVQNRSVDLFGLAMGLKAKIYQFDSFSPYVLGGLGIYSPQVTRVVNNQVVDSDRKLIVGNHLGIGGDLALNDRVKVGALIHYHNPFDVKQDTGADVEGSYVKLLMTAMYTF